MKVIVSVTGIKTQENNTCLHGVNTEKSYSSYIPASIGDSFDLSSGNVPRGSGLPVVLCCLNVTGVTLTVTGVAIRLLLVTLTGNESSGSDDL